MVIVEVSKSMNDKNPRKARKASAFFVVCEAGKAVQDIRGFE
jgi:hypothetical protein